MQRQSCQACFLNRLLLQAQLTRSTTCPARVFLFSCCFHFECLKNVSKPKCDALVAMEKSLIFGGGNRLCLHSTVPPHKDTDLYRICVSTTLVCKALIINTSTQDVHGFRLPGSASTPSVIPFHGSSCFFFCINLFSFLLL